MTGMSEPSSAIKNHAQFIWSVADLLRGGGGGGGDYKQSEYGKVVLPLTVLRRFDCVLAPVKADMLSTHERLVGKVASTASRPTTPPSPDGASAATTTCGAST